MSQGIRSVLSVAAIVVSAAAVFYPVTRGFRTVTADGARQIDLARNPRALASLVLLDSEGKRLLLSDVSTGAADWTVVTLVYTHCMTVCRTSAAGLAYLQESLGRHRLGGQVQLLTLSFDPARDTPAELRRYARGQGANADVWRFATVASRSDLASLLRLFEIVVLPDGLGGYSHNAALFLINRNGLIVRAYDVDRPDRVLADLVQTRQCCG